VSPRDIAEPVDLVDPVGTRRAATLSPAGHVALFVRALHAPAAAALRRRAGEPGLVEACAVTRGRDGRPRPHRSGESEQFHRCGDPAALQTLASATRAAGRECWCSVLPRTEAVAGGKAVAGGMLLWADVDTPGTLWRAAALRARVAVRLVVESGGASDPREPRWHLYLAASRWLAADELEAANARLAQLLGGDRVGDRGRLMRLPGTRNLKGGREGRWCRVVACELHAPAVDVEALLGAPPPRAAPTQSGSRPRAAVGSPLESLPPREWFASSSPTARSASTATRTARCTTTTSPPSSSATSPATAGTAGRARAEEISSSTRRGAGSGEPPATSTRPSSADSSPACRSN
jgi:hypothetical protein